MITSAPIRVALIGYGYVSKTFHAPLISAVPGLQLVVVSSSDPAKVHADLPDAEVVSDPLKAATHPGVDVVVIASPNETHAPLAEAAIETGKDVVVDKPFTLTLEDARRLAAIAEARGRLLAVFHNRRWDSDYLAVRTAIEEGRLGGVRHFESHFDRYRPEVVDRWRERAGPGSGVWYDLGPHLIDQALQLFGLPAAVLGNLALLRDGSQAVDWAHIVLIYGRLRVILHCSMLVAGGSPRFTVHGTKGSLVKLKPDGQESQLRAGMRPGNADWGIDPDPAVFYDGGSGRSIELPAPRGDYRKYYEAFREAVLGRAPNPVTPLQGIAVMAVLETAMVSSNDGRMRTLPLTDKEKEAWS